MPANPPANMPRISPYLYYKNVAAALEWLARAFGFKERVRMPGPDGGIMHAEIGMCETASSCSAARARATGIHASSVR